MGNPCVPNKPKGRKKTRLECKCIYSTLGFTMHWNVLVKAHHGYFECSLVTLCKFWEVIVLVLDGNTMRYCSRNENQRIGHLCVLLRPCRSACFSLFPVVTQQGGCL